MKKMARIFSVLMVGSLAVMLITTGLYAAGSPLGADIQDYVGTYTVSGLPFEKVVVSDKAGKLHYVAGEYEGDFTEISGKADTYSANGEATVTFMRNAAGKVDKMKLEIQGESYEGMRSMEEMAGSSVALTDYVGKYKMENLPFEFIVLSMKDNQLYITAGDNEGTLTAMPNQMDAFDAGGQATIKFTRDDQKKINKIVVEAQGQVFEGTPVTQ
ncbi:hypothetical protein [Salmonirosea aquatica]|uniref:DUF3471 domain-containing protein n=1 Tax=Salmonirosea aquatica TaxID=2654236 RepID=A0A7C9FZ08_9BACT|nr:hypothetical protein [Cytophagaceae bacterium SJW1-29]